MLFFKKIITLAASNGKRKVSSDVVRPSVWLSSQAYNLNDSPEGRIKREQSTYRRFGRKVHSL